MHFDAHAGDPIPQPLADDAPVPGKYGRIGGASGTYRRRLTRCRPASHFPEK